MSESLVSVIVPNYNYERYLGECIFSVINQTYRNLEIIVVDNFSSDGSKKVVESLHDPRISFIQFDNKGAVGRSRNHGARIASGEYLAFLDSDDVWLPHKLSEQMKTFNESVGMSFHNFRVQGRSPLKKIKGRVITGGVTDLLTFGNPIVTSGVVIRTALFSKLKGFPEEIDFHTAEDLHLWCKVAESGYDLRFVNRVLGKYRLHGSSSRHMDAPLALRKVILAFGQHLGTTDMQRAMAIADYAEGVIRSNSREERAAKESFLSALVKKPRFKFLWRSLLRLLQISCRILVRGSSSPKSL